MNIPIADLLRETSSFPDPVSLPETQLVSLVVETTAADLENADDFLNVVKSTVNLAFQSQAVAQSTPGKEKPVQILLVEDNAGDVRLLREMFTQEKPGSFQLTHVLRMREAEIHLAKGGVDVIMLDMGLPDEHGLDTIRRARAAAPGIPVIVLTGLDDEALAAEAMKQGAQDYLIKGQIESRALPRALRHAIESHRMRAESDLIRELRAQERVSSVLECTSDSVITISHDWILLYGNRKAMESLPDFEVGKSYWSCFPGVISTPAEQHLRGAMEGRSDVKFESYYAPDERWSRVHAFPTDDGLSIFFSNITEEKKMQNQLELEQLLREKRIEALSHMAGGLAHEINNPLAIIQGRAIELKDLAAGDEPLAVRVRAACENIIQTSDRAIKILRGLKGFGREASKDPMEFASIYEIIEQCVELQQARFHTGNIEVRLALEPEIPLLLCRETQVGQILTNVLNNAFDAIVQSNSMERWISVTAERVENTIHIYITDSGPGIEDHFKAHLMEPFFTTKELGLGMGVGLSLSRAIAQDHGGTLALCKETEHTCFRLILPIMSSGADQKNIHQWEVAYQPE